MYLGDFCQSLDALLADVAQVVGRRTVELSVDDLFVQLGNVPECDIGLFHVAGERVAERGAKIREPLRHLVELRGEALRLDEQHLPLRGGSRADGDALEGIEKIRELVTDAVLAATAGCRRGFCAGRLLIDHLPESGLHELQRALLRFMRAAHAGLAGDLAVQQDIANLPDGDRIGARALRPDFGRDVDARLDGHALARVARRVDVGEVMAGGFRALPLRLQRPVRHAEGAE